MVLHFSENICHISNITKTRKKNHEHQMLCEFSSAIQSLRQVMPLLFNSFLSYHTFCRSIVFCFVTSLISPQQQFLTTSKTISKINSIKNSIGKVSLYLWFTTQLVICYRFITLYCHIISCIVPYYPFCFILYSSIYIPKVSDLITRFKSLYNCCWWFHF